VLGGAPPRIALAPTTDSAAAKAAILGAEESDRATDLEGALALADGLIDKLPQSDKRVLLLSDRADGHSAARVASGMAALWAPLPELSNVADDCAALEATLKGASVHVRFACNRAEALRGLSMVVENWSGDGKRTELARTSLAFPPEIYGSEVASQEPQGTADAPVSSDVTIPLPAETGRFLVARLVANASGKVDAISSDDATVVALEDRALALAVVSAGRDEAVATGGAPLIEQALAALKTGISVSPIPNVPDRNEDYAPFSGVLVDDAPGLTPEQRRATQQFVEAGGLALLAFGPRAAAANLGASFEPMFTQPLRWGKSPSTGINVEDASLFRDSRSSLADIEPRGRTSFGADDIGVSRVRAQWNDGAPFLLSRAFKLGEFWMLSLPLGAEYSELPLRPGFLTLVDAFLRELAVRATPARGTVGTTWTLRGERVVGYGPLTDGKLEAAQASSGADARSGASVRLVREGAIGRFVPALIGAYTLTMDGKSERRVAVANAQELDFRPRRVEEATLSGSGKAARPPVDVSWVVALILLLLFASELGLRAFFVSKARTEVRVPSTKTAASQS
jgi:hypothetical protein